MRRVLLFASIVAASTALWASAAGAQIQPSPIGPNQLFNGLVNGSSGSAVIRMACFGPIRPGQTGHPFAGQTVAVSRALEAGPGFTGLADSIAATLFYPSPVAGTGTAVALAVFRYYNLPAPISTALNLPCAGRGSVVFNPVLGGPSARPAVVRVYFVGQP
jgi:hypothetical protein